MQTFISFKVTLPDCVHKLWVDVQEEKHPNPNNQAFHHGRHGCRWFFFGIAVESGVCVVVVSSSSSLWFNSVPTSQSHDESFMESLATPTCGEE